tara:strand:+ start:4829 stop:5068 length:240 start_codon:yes stop_codon:yes gene_type:complete
MSSSTTSADGLDPEMHKVQAAWEDASIAERYANSENATRPFAKVLVEKADLATRSEPANVYVPHPAYLYLPWMSLKQVL